MIKRVATGLFTLLLLIACEASQDPVRTPRTLLLTAEDSVRANFQVVVEALARYAADNNGKYPGWVAPEFISYLPDGLLISNPLTGERSEPRDWDCDLEPAGGQIVYQAEAVTYEGYPYPYPAYALRGHGKDGMILETQVGADSLFGRDEAVLANCLAVRDAVELFALRNSGVYPDDLTDTDEDGDTVVDLLPEASNLLNPYHLCYCEPRDGAAVGPGETGYVVMTDIYGDNIGYVITGWGLHCEIFVLEKPQP